MERPACNYDFSVAQLTLRNYPLNLEDSSNTGIIFRSCQPHEEKRKKEKEEKDKARRMANDFIPVEEKIFPSGLA